MSEALVTLLDVGPVAARFQVTRTVGVSALALELVVWRDLPRLDWRVRLDWRERTDGRRTPSLKLGFHLNVSAARLLRSSPFALSQSPADGQERSTQHVSVLSGDQGGFALLNRGNYGFDALGSRLRASLVRGFAGPDPDGDLGMHQSELALIDLGSAPDPAMACMEGLAFNRPPIAIADHVPRYAGQAPQIVARHLLVSSVEQCAEGSWEIRATAMAGVPGSLSVSMPEGIAAAESVDFLGRRFGEQPVIDGGRLRMEVPAWRILTLRIARG